MSDRIWLEPACADAERCWSSEPVEDCCEEGCGMPAVAYVRADVADAKIARLTEQVRVLREALTVVRDRSLQNLQFPNSAANAATASAALAATAPQEPDNA